MRQARGTGKCDRRRRLWVFFSSDLYAGGPSKCRLGEISRAGGGRSAREQEALALNQCVSRGDTLVPRHARLTHSYARLSQPRNVVMTKPFVQTTHGGFE